MADVLCLSSHFWVAPLLVLALEQPLLSSRLFLFVSCRAYLPELLELHGVLSLLSQMLAMRGERMQFWGKTILTISVPLFKSL